MANTSAPALSHPVSFAALATRLAPSTADLIIWTLYYGVLALALFAGIDVPGAVVAIAYLLPVAAHLGRVLGKGPSQQGKPTPKAA